MRFKSFKLGKSKEAAKDAAEAGDTLTTQVASMGENVNNKTRELEATEKELKKLSDTVKGSEDEGDTPRPHKPLSELSVEPGEELVEEDADLDSVLGETGEDVKVVEVGAEAAATAKVEKEPAATEDNDSIASLFADDDDEVNPLASLINALPDVSAQELVDDLSEIHEIIREGRTGQT